jgi:outer membrane protein assembly factor BamE (lipoprotein component of BamABCDE complex)
MQGITDRRRPLHRALLPLYFSFFGLLAAGCMYQMPIQQGNHLEEKTIDQIKPGMTRGQVRYLLGTPMVPGMFERDRWDYDYYLKLRRLSKVLHYHVTVWFKADVVDHVDSDLHANPREPVTDRKVTNPGA